MTQSTASLNNTSAPASGQSTEDYEIAALRERNAAQGKPLDESLLMALRCHRCGSEWIVRSADLDEQRVCPFCIASITQTAEPERIDTLGKAIYAVLRREGQEILRTPETLAAQLSALAPTLEREVHIFYKTVTAQYADDLEHIFRAETISAAEQRVSAIRERFVREEGLADFWADTLSEGIFSAVLLSRGIAPRRVTHVTMRDFVAVRKRETNAPGRNVPGKSAPERAAAQQARRPQAATSAFQGIETPPVPQGKALTLRAWMDDPEVIASFRFREGSYTRGDFTVPNGYTQICAGGLSVLEVVELTLPQTVARIDPEALADCRSLERVRVAAGNRWFHLQDGKLYDLAAGTILWSEPGA